MKVATNKSQAAIRQLDVAVDLLFKDYDPLAVRTLASAAFELLSDLVESKQPSGSWREKLINDSGLPRNLALNVLHGASNFLKHADRDPEANLIFDEEENDHLIFFATIECGELGTALSYPMQAFQVWYLACYPDHLGIQVESVQKAGVLLPDINSLARQEQLQRGLLFLSQVISYYASKP